MKYLGLHKIIWAILVLGWVIVEILICGLIYILYVMWNFKLPHKLWLKLHSYMGSLDWEYITDRNPIQTFVRRYNSLNYWL